MSEKTELTCPEPKPVTFPTPDELYFKVDGTLYRWMYCGQIESREEGIVVGQIRALGVNMFRASRIEKKLFRKPAVTWSWMRQEDSDYRASDRLRYAIFIR